jgi:outer membrane protein OmpA-like peptidoglycan-associated protein
MNQKMRSYISFFIVAVVVFSLQDAPAQVKVDLGKKIEREADKRVNKQADKAIDNTFDAAGDAITGNSSEKNEKSDKTTPASKTSEKTGTSSKNDAEKSSDSGKSQLKQNTGEPQETGKPVLTWNKYDFVPGTEIIFEDNQEGEQNGEFPSKWNLKSGTIENAILDGVNIIWLRKSNSTITPLIKVKDYLPEEFTIEFDYLMLSPTQRAYHVYFIGDGGKGTNGRILFHGKNLDFSNPGKAGSTIKGDINAGFVSGWKHAAISFNKRALKVYVDDQRVLNIPNVEGSLKSFNIGIGNAGSATEAETVIKNIRVAKGAVPLYDKFLTDGKFVTTGIKFDVNKATIKPESMGTINYVVKMMTEHPELNFSVEGHTDSDGDEAANQKLSEARAQSVLNEMTKLGISASRLTSKGHGETKPMAGNDTPEGKAQNRRVEFVKF